MEEEAAVADVGAPGSDVGYTFAGVGAPHRLFFCFSGLHLYID